MQDAASVATAGFVQVGIKVYIYLSIYVQKVSKTSLFIFYDCNSQEKEEDAEEEGKKRGVSGGSK